ncbi:MAG: substrate-binding domain-containing protein [Phycisphaerae bacterium]
MSRTRRVGVCIDLNWPVVHHLAVYSGIRRFASQQGRWELGVNPFFGSDRQRSDRRPDGVVGRMTVRGARRARRWGIPAVNVWFNSPVRGLPGVFPDMESAGRTAAEHLLARGFHRFGFLGYHRNRATSGLLAGMRDRLADGGDDCSVRRVRRQFARSRGTWDAFIENLYGWVAEFAPPVGILGAHDLLCRYLMNVCTERGLEIPYDVGMVGTFNEPLICEALEPTLTSIDLAYERVGYLAAEMLDGLMAGRPAPAEPLRVEPAGLVPRRSSDAFAVGDPLVAGALRFMADHVHERIGVEEVARHMETTRTTLGGRFRRALGRTVRDELARLRVERAKRLLRESDDNLHTVATACGFRDDSRMSKTFMRLEGMRPGAFRQQHRETG